MKPAEETPNSLTDEILCLQAYRWLRETPTLLATSSMEMSWE